MPSIQQQAEIPHALALERLDVAAAKLFPEFSRAQLQGWIRAGDLTVDGRRAKPKDKVQGGAMLSLDAELASLEDEPEDLELKVVHEDDQILVIDKSPGMVVHPGAGNRTGTLLNALLHHAPDLEQLPRAGIVHRLDKDTSGLLVIARSSSARLHLIHQLKTREMGRVYYAVVYGRVTLPGTVDAPIGRHPQQRVRMAIRQEAREAITHYRPVTVFNEHTLLELRLETGRTHQIRVHMQHLGYPLVGDPMYGGTFRKPRQGSEALTEKIRTFPRQALHAARLHLVHPGTEAEMEFSSDMPADMTGLLDLMA